MTTIVESTACFAEDRNEQGLVDLLIRRNDGKGPVRIKASELNVLVLAASRAFRDNTGSWPDVWEP